MTGKMSISGVQPKILVTNDKSSKTYVVTEHGDYILKPQTQSFAYVPENENLCMDIAGSLGMETPFHELVRLKDDSLAYVVKRFDRLRKKKIHQEDFAQILSKDKYKGSVEAIGNEIKKISEIPGLDIQLFFDRVVLNFLIGNGDAHLKNYSMVYKPDNKIRLSPVYDLVSSKIVIPNEEESALTINGKKNNLLKEDFDNLANNFKIPEKVRYMTFSGKKQIFEEHIKRSFLPENHKNSFQDIVNKRFSILFERE